MKTYIFSSLTNSDLEELQLTMSVPEGTTVIKVWDGEIYFYKPLDEPETPIAGQSIAPSSFVWIDGDWEYSYIEI